MVKKTFFPYYEKDFWWIVQFVQMLVPKWSSSRNSPQNLYKMGVSLTHSRFRHESYLFFLKSVRVCVVVGDTYVNTYLNSYCFQSTLIQISPQILEFQIYWLIYMDHLYPACPQTGKAQGGSRWHQHNPDVKHISINIKRIHKNTC